MIPSMLILGSAAAIADADHANTHMALRGPNGTILIDCADEPAIRLPQAGLALDDIADLILTHFHPDHVGGVPLFMMAAWMQGRTAPLTIYGLKSTLANLDGLMDAYNWAGWAGFFKVRYRPVEETVGAFVMETPDFRITAAPVRHYVPTIGLRVEARATGFVLAYSSDTAPWPATVELARGADLLIHEAAGSEPLGHSSGAEAGEIARRAGVGRLGLIHYRVDGRSPADLAALRAEAEAAFGGPAFLCEDFQEIPLNAE